MNIKNDLTGLTRGLSKNRAGRVILYTFIFGLLAHGILLFNKLSWHDDIVHGYMLLSIHKPIAMGRWFRAFLARVVAWCFGDVNLSLPLFNGAFSIFFIACAAWLVIETFKIEDKRFQAALCGIMVAFPVVTSIFAYMFTAPYYFLALFLSVAGVYIASRGGTWLRVLLASGCICLGLGTYQAFFAVPVSLFVLLIVFDIVDGEFPTVPQLLKRGFYYLGVCVAAMAEYLVLWKVSMALDHYPTTDYEGFSAIGQSKLHNYIHAILRAYRSFFQSYESDFENLFPMKIKYLQWLIVALCLVCAAVLIVRVFRKKKLQGLLLALLLLALPLCLNLIYLMAATTPDSTMHTLMFYGQTMLYVFLIGAAQRLRPEGKRAGRALYGVSLFLVLALACSHLYFDNACYLKAQMAQQQTISNLTVLVSQIKSVEGYNDKMPVCLVVKAKRDATATVSSWYDDIKIKPYDNYYLLMPHHFSEGRNLRNTLKNLCGFSPKYVSAAPFKDLEEVQQMPDYPDAGSIRVIDGTIVVKI